MLSGVGNIYRTIIDCHDTIGLDARVLWRSKEMSKKMKFKKVETLGPGTPVLEDRTGKKPMLVPLATKIIVIGRLW
jgi:hypothetical protein